MWKYLSSVDFFIYLDILIISFNQLQFFQNLFIISPNQLFFWTKLFQIQFKKKRKNLLHFTLSYSLSQDLGILLYNHSNSNDCKIPNWRKIERNFPHLARSSAKRVYRKGGSVPISGTASEVRVNTWDTSRENTVCDNRMVTPGTLYPHTRLFRHPLHQ